LIEKPDKAKVPTGKWSGYSVNAKELNITQIISNKELNSQTLNIIIH